MSAKQVLIIVHGMGDHTKESFTKEVVGAANNALIRYPNYKNKKFENEVFVEPISYNHIFEEMRTKMKTKGASLQTFIKSELGGVNIPSFFTSLNDIEASLGDNTFANTHVLDVIFYLSILGEKVRIYVQQEIIKITKKYQQTTEINILAHSLGTAVTHDALNKLFTTGKTTDLQLNIVDHKINSLWMIANVSDIITSFSGLTDPKKSIVNPGGDGCVTKFYNAFHELDPFTLKVFKRFDPNNRDNWLSDSVYKHRYVSFKTEKVSRPNTHDIMGYLEDPIICHEFLNQFFDFKPEGQEKEKGDEAFKNIQDDFKTVKKRLNKISDKDDLKDFINLLKDFKDFL